MTDYLRAALDDLVPDFVDERGDWSAVARDAGVRGSTMGSVRRRRIAVLVILVAAVAVPLAAVAASQEWWFFQFGRSPTPITDVKVLRDGWGGQDWQLVAYLSSTDGICFGINPSTEGGGAMSCALIEGVPRTSESKPYTPHAISYLSGSSEGLPTYAVGPVAEAATEVAIVLADGTEVRTPTFDVPDELGAIRFYATLVPDALRVTPQAPRMPVRKLIGFDSDGEVVACLTNPIPEEGMTLAACR